MGDNNEVVLVTGGTSGIGRIAARKLAGRGATVIITGRRRKKGATALAEIQDAHSEGAGAFYRANFADLDDVRQLAADIRTDYDRLDVLVNNAGTGQATRVLTDDDIELTFAVNYVAPFLLTNQLVPRLRESAPARVLNTVTVAQDDSFADMRGAELSDLDAVATGNYGSFDLDQAYVNSKLALVLFTYELADRLAGTGVKVACFHPGWIGASDITRDAPWSAKILFRIAGLVARVAPVWQLETPEGAADVLVHHALDQDLPDGEGRYFDRQTRADPGPRAHDEELRDQLWEYTADLSEVSEPVPTEEV